MVSKKVIEKYINSQKSIQFYPKVQKALRVILLKMPNEDYNKATKNTVLMVIHEGVGGQLMYHPSIKSKFKILQLSIAKQTRMDVLKYIIAHELGHAVQGRNWKDGDGDSLEIFADKKAKEWGFPKTAKIIDYMKASANETDRMYNKINKKL